MDEADSRVQLRIARQALLESGCRDGVLVILFDEAEDDASRGGGRTGAVLLSPQIAPGKVVRTPIDHHGYLRSVEELLGLPPLGRETPTFQSIGAFSP